MGLLNISGIAVRPVNFSIPYKHIMTLSDRTVSVREIAAEADFDNCFHCLKSIPQTISCFFTHRYADFRMFWRAFNSMTFRTTSLDVDRRVDALYQFRTQVVNQVERDHAEAVYQRFLCLNPQVQDLLFYVDRPYLRRFRSEADPDQIEQMRDEIVRECDLAISYQQNLAFILNFYPLGHSSDEIEGPGNDEIIGTSVDNESSASISNPTSSHIERVNLNIPGTVRYVQNNIPHDVAQKAAEIARLKTRLNHLLDHLPLRQIRIPSEYFSVLTLPSVSTVMQIPIFDASHPFVQNALREGNVTRLNNRTERHHLDHFALEGRISRLGWCPQCLHPPVPRVIDREHVLIDTALQEDILQFLRAQVAAAERQRDLLNRAVTTTALTSGRRAGVTLDTRIQPAVDLNIPGTVPYLQNNIPADIQARAAEIARLRGQFDTLAHPPTIPDVYSCPIALEIMTIPVFDGSHTAVQNALRAANAPGGTTTALNNRVLRHALEFDSMEGHLATSRSWAPAKCQICRHPEDGGIRRANLRIDSALQEEILGWLRNAVASGGSTSS